MATTGIACFEMILSKKAAYLRRRILNTKYDYKLKESVMSFTSPRGLRWIYALFCFASVTISTTVTLDDVTSGRVTTASTTELIGFPLDENKFVSRNEVNMSKFLYLFFLLSQAGGAVASNAVGKFP